MKRRELAKALGFALMGAAVHAQVAKPTATPEAGVTREVLFDEKAFRATATISIPPSPTPASPSWRAKTVMHCWLFCKPCQR